ncbi:MAG: MATE family efflux transporter [Candidatus Latescibacterota bacterium]
MQRTPRAPLGAESATPPVPAPSSAGAAAGRAAPAGPRPGRDLTSGSIPRHIVLFSLPMLAGSLLHMSYSIVNAVWVGRFLGKSSLAAVTVAFPILFLVMAISNGFSMGASILVSQHTGARDWPAVRRVVQSGTLLICCLCLVLLTAGQVVIGPLLDLVDTPPEVMPLALPYMRLVLLALPAMFLITLFAGLLRGVGDSTTPLWFQMGGLLLTAVLDPLLMFGWLGMPRLGLMGTAVASLLTQGLALVTLVAYLQARKHAVAPDLPGLRLDRTTVGQIARIGLPSVLQQGMVSLGILFVVGLVNQFGADATAALGAAGRVDQIASLPAMTFGMAISTLAGQNIGAGDYERVRRVFWWGVLISGGTTLLLSAVIVAFPEPLLALFVNSRTDPQVTTMGRSYLQTVVGCFAFFAVMFVSNGIINGAGHTLVTTFFTFIAMWLVRIPLAWWLSQRVMHRVEGVWIAMGTGFFVAMVVSVGYFLSGRWKKPVVRRGIPAAGPRH